MIDAVLVSSVRLPLSPCSPLAQPQCVQVLTPRHCLQELERHFEQAHKAYLESTEHRTQAFKQLTKNDAASARVIEKRMKKLIKLQVHDGDGGVLGSWDGDEWVGTCPYGRYIPLWAARCAWTAPDSSCV